jgi:aminopeptidase N
MVFKCILLCCAAIAGPGVGLEACAGNGPAGMSPSGPVENCPHSVDILHYGITLLVDIDNETISGSTTVTALSQESGLDDLQLDLAALTVDSVLSMGAPVDFTHAGPVLSVDLGRVYEQGDTVEVEVFYGGHPGNNGTDELGGFYFDGVPTHAFQVGRTLGATQPSMGKYLFPCWDWPCDKATAEFHITVPGVGRKVICNGVLTSAVVDSVAGTATYHWVEDCPIATHRIALHAGKYAELVDSTYDFIRYFVYPRQIETALINFANVDGMMDAFEEAFGPYPFAKCAYVVSGQADVGHQNCIAYPAGAVTASHGNDWQVARGLARQWWGACVGMADWRDVWLCESFGRYGEPLFEESAYGDEAYHDYVYENLILHTFADVDPYSSVYDPSFPGGHTIYEKGTVVLHMLRYVLGDSAFFDALKAFRQAYEYDIAVTADFETSVEASSGMDLGWFFNEWLYDCGWPEYEYAWNAVPDGEVYDLALVINQVQTVGPVFAMPLDVGVALAGGDTVLTIWVDQAHEEYSFAVAGEPLGVEIDPHRWVLQRSTEVAYAAVRRGGDPAGLLGIDVAPNPSRAGAVIRYSIPDGGRAGIYVYDVRGRQVAALLEGVPGPGAGEVFWDGRVSAGHRAAPGTYFCRLVTGAGSTTASLILIP